MVKIKISTFRQNVWSKETVVTCDAWWPEVGWQWHVGIAVSDLERDTSVMICPIYSALARVAAEMSEALDRFRYSMETHGLTHVEEMMNGRTSESMARAVRVLGR